jgi:hypothetical protein
MRRARIVIALALVVLAFAIGYRLLLYSPKDLKPVDVAGYESDMTEALLRDAFQKVLTNQASAYFLAFGHRLTPPTEAFLARFSGNQPPVKSYSVCSISPAGDIVDSSNGTVGVMVQIASITRESSGRFDVEAAFSNLPSSGNRLVYTIAQEAGVWKVKSRKPYEVK